MNLDDESVRGRDKLANSEPTERTPFDRHGTMAS